MEFKEIYGYKVSMRGYIIGPSGKKLVPYDNGRGYPIVTVTISGKRTSKAVHRLVAEAWLSNPENLPEINHKDCNRANYNIGNLEWCTHGYNIAYSYKAENRSATGEFNANSITTQEVVIKICKRLSSGASAVALRNEGYDYELVRAIKARKNWKHISKDYVW